MKLDVKIEDIPFGTSIQEIVVPDVLKTRIKTGIEWFDCVLGGEGFTPSMVTLFTGTPGAGKTTMMLALANSLQGHGAQVIFNTAEESLYQIKMTAERLKLRHSFMVGGEDNVRSACVPRIGKAVDGQIRSNSKVGPIPIDSNKLPHRLISHAARAETVTDAYSYTE